MVRQTFLNQIRAALGEVQPFRSEDFDITQRKFVPSRAAEEVEEVMVRYRFDPAYEFSFTVSPPTHGQSPHLTFIAKPGAISSVTNGITQNGADILQQIDQWLQRTAEELSNVPQQRRVEAQQQAIDALTEQVGELSDTYYTRAEAQDMEARLDQLRKEIYEQFAALQEDQGVVDGQMESIDSDIADLKLSLETLKKPGWTKAFATRFLRWTAQAENRDLLEAGTKLLLSEGKRHIT